MSSKKRRNLPPQNHQVLQQQPIKTQLHAIQQQEFSGPIPPPAMLNEYNQIVPGFAERIVTMAEQEQAQRHKQESAINEANIEVAHKNLGNTKRGQWMAFSIAISVIFLSALLISLGHSITGTILGGGMLVALVGAFLKVQNQSIKK